MRLKAFKQALSGIYISVKNLVKKNSINPKKGLTSNCKYVLIHTLAWGLKEKTHYEDV